MLIHTFNNLLYIHLCDECDVKFIKLGRLRWAEHLMRLEESDPANKDLCMKQGEEVVIREQPDKG
jgi:hypothetical protein